MTKTLLVLLSAAAIAACGGKPVAQTQTQTQAPAPAPAKVEPAPAPSAASSTLVTGTVAETMNAAGYTYIRIATAGGDRWAAVPETKLKEGDSVTVTAQMVVPNFESKTLGRKFENIIFGSMPGAKPVERAAPAQPAPATTAPADVHVEKAPGGKTIAEVWAEKSALKDKPVVVRGTVVKFLPQIMGKNWIHLRDGSGTRAKGDDDVTVTTNASVKIGDVITVSGTLRVDKDFGAGYQYGVIIEDAKVTPR